MPATRENANTWRLGHGRATVARVAGRSVCVRDQSSDPLKLLCPDHGGPAAWLYAGTYGGGLVAGDRIELDLDVEPDAAAVLTTQASTKVYHQHAGRGAQQHLRTTVASGGLLACVPDPLTCFADAVYDQTQRFDLAADASLVLVDWLTAGRAAMGESWRFARYASRNDVLIDGRRVAREAMRLDRDDGDLADAMITGHDHCLATVLLIGPACETAGQAWHDELQQSPWPADTAIRAGSSRWPWGVVVRLAGPRTSDVAALLKDKLAFLEPRLGRGVWDRKG
jgi:urease accessory protein